MRRLVAVLSDTHGGHTLGLLNPETVLPEEDENGDVRWVSPRLSLYQEFLWTTYTANLQALVELARGDEVVAVHNGDLTQGQKYPQHWVSTRMADQILIAIANMQPLVSLSLVKTVRFAKGTGSHVFDEGSSTILVAMQLQNQFQEKDIEAVYHGLIDVDGVTFDYAHHGPSGGIREWTKGNQVRYYLRSQMMGEMMDGRRPPRVYLRSHYHTFVQETVREEFCGDPVVSDLVVTPSYCGLGDHGIRATRSIYRVKHGMVVFEIIDGRLVQTHPLIATLDLRTKERL
jgi:hypothetical protein